ncbi:Protein of unknown function [Pyronema omphalodes CBS 100304]|uniref:Uncharacterized protein n=1 Tax=Pyronema omphalodes (strain CBS 100304) TaxID=1076935 RepID=U4L560_PYROM|nr:Protein of unknown function [Pyronema omphalodes CBS 100304]
MCLRIIVLLASNFSYHRYYRYSLGYDFPAQRQGQIGRGSGLGIST